MITYEKQSLRIEKFTIRETGITILELYSKEIRNLVTALELQVG
jgi:hypothetical protein